MYLTPIKVHTTTPFLQFKTDLSIILSAVSSRLAMEPSRCWDISNPNLHLPVSTYLPPGVCERSEVWWFELLRSVFLTPSLAQEHAVLPHGEEGCRPCELPWVLSLSLYCLLTLHMFCLPKNFKLIMLWYFLKQITRLNTIYARCNTPHHGFHVIDVHNLIGGFPAAVPGGQGEKLWQEFFGSFALVGSQFREGNWTSILSKFTCEWSHSYC